MSTSLNYIDIVSAVMVANGFCGIIIGVIMYKQNKIIKFIDDLHMKITNTL